MSIDLTPTENATWLLSGQLLEDEPVRTIRITSSPFTVGRKTSMSLTIDSPSVSGSHAELILEEGNLWVS